ncbi:MFS transporter [Streptoalloteichus hindustanus]|uniref:Drug resistance transporter, EmrB/QacA subfamily n=1 Tax=Streptoalloteichus hindustanus TaxID=2017 RepID=A0A1M4YMX2_STRHI|nr:MFS transporter [Streptoalloteichus hindustanus]SHF07165.1 drug resistance transporter, EmrB/QacA subfamily [Streptoalloteichus hindustanus]
MSASLPGAGRRRLGWSLALLALAQLITALDLNIVFVALPEIGAGLGFSEQSLQWVVSAYTVFCGGFLLLGGRAADLLGRRRMFVFALLLYAVSSLVGGLAWTPMLIVVARAVQGIGGALLFPATLSLVNTLFEEGPRRNRALAVWGGAGASGLTLGSLLGGLLTASFGWAAVFYVNVPLAGIVALAALAVIPRDERREQRRGFDLPGAITVSGGVTLLVYVLVQGPESGWTATDVVVSAVLSVVLLVAFAVIEARSKDPLMPLRLFRNRSLVAAMTITFLYMGTFGALPYFLTVLFQNVHHYSALTTGLAFLVPSLSIAAGTQIGERMATRMTTRTTLLVGHAVGVVGTVVMVFGFAVGSSYLAIVPGLVVSGVGQGVTWTGMWIAAAAGVAPEEQGVASGMASTTQNVGNAIGIAVLVAIANSGLADLAPGAAGEQVAGVMTDGMRVAVLLAAAGMVLGLLVTLALPRAAASAPRPAPEPGQPADAPPVEVTA